MKPLENKIKIINKTCNISKETIAHSDEKRPNLDKNLSIKDFQDFYWLKKELVTFCRKIGITSAGGKINIANRIKKYLNTGEIITSISQKNRNCQKHLNQ